MKRSLISLFAGVLASCSASSAEGGAPLRDDGPAARLDNVIGLDQRVSAIAWRLLNANKDLCPLRRPLPGWALHAASQYGAELRPIAERRFGLEGDLPGVLAVAPGAPAALAGLTAGDLVTAVNGVALDAGAGGAVQTYAGLSENIAALDAAFAAGPATLTVRRQGQARTVVVRPAEVCGYRFQIDASDQYRARADGHGVFVSSRLANFATDDSDLAFILAHEMAHDVLQHQPPRDPRGRALPRLTGGMAPGDPAHAEQEADRVGLYLTARAGFAYAQAPRFMRRFGEANWRVRFAQVGHPSAGVRAQRLEAVSAEIAARQAAGLPVLP